MRMHPLRSSLLGSTCAAVLCATVVAGVGSTAPAAAEAPPHADARQVAARVQAFYDQTRNVQARFYQTYYHRLYGRYQRSRGHVAFEKPGRFRFDYARPNGKVIANDGRQLVMYEPGDDGGSGQHAVRDAGRAALPDAFGFLTGTTALGRDFHLRLLDARRWGFDGHVLELRPRQAKAHYRRIILYVDADPKRAGVVHKVRIDDHEGNRNKLELYGMRFNRSLQDGRFAFVPPASSRPIRM